MFKWSLLLCVLVSANTCSAQSVAAVNGACPSTTREATQSTIESQVDILLRDNVIPSLQNRSYPPCQCGGPGEWTRVVYLNMSDPSQQCPSNWRLLTTPVRGCIRPSNSSACDSVIFSLNSRSYSHVCGRVHAYQYGSPNAFDTTSRPGLESTYIDGVSLTHGAAGSRQHIWSFVAALYEINSDYRPHHACACNNINEPWPYQVPSFVGNNYFCATGNHGLSASSSVYYPDDVMWDGKGCGPTNACCTLNNPPWFCTTLPQPTTEDIEARICGNQPPNNEESIVSLLDIYVM